MTTADRFWSKVEFEPNTGCGFWTARLFRGCYGQFWLDGRQQRANRVAWMLEHGPIPDGMWVLHRCHNPMCVNPDHLYLGDHDRNMQDMVDAGRQAIGEKNGSRLHPERRPRGEKHYCAKLTSAQVLEIRRDYVSGSRTHGTVALGRRYGVGQAQIGRIVNWKRWAEGEE